KIEPKIIQRIKNGTNTINKECQLKYCKSIPEAVGPKAGPNVSIEAQSP
ncbi:hypothetical protein DE169_001566, partial [Clostridium acetobutylicum]|nr:hypothetical protein [Clostridium acetobutylicum]